MIPIKFIGKLVLSYNLLLFIPFISSSQQYTTGKFSLKVDVSGLSKEISMIYLGYTDNNINFMDSAIVKDRTALFKGKITEPVRVKMRLAPKDGELNVDGKEQIQGFPPKAKNQFYFFLDSGNVVMRVKEPLVKSEIENSKAQNEYVALADALEPLNNRKDSFFVKYIEYDKAKDSAGIEKVTVGIINVDEEISKLYKEYVEKNPSSKLSAYALSRYALSGGKLKDIEPLLKLLSAKIKRSYSVISLIQTLTIKERLAIGTKITDFELPDLQNKKVSLSSFRGKYVLVDFWASWCGPCRSENVNLVKAYNRYKDKSFEILSISLDKLSDKKKWTDAIIKDNLLWTNVSDLKAFDGPVAKLFGLTSLPFNILLDKQGKIIGKNLRGESLMENLGKLLDEKILK